MLLNLYFHHTPRPVLGGQVVFRKIQRINRTRENDEALLLSLGLL